MFQNKPQRTNPYVYKYVKELTYIASSETNANQFSEVLSLSQKQSRSSAVNQFFSICSVLKRWGTRSLIHKNNPAGDKHDTNKKTYKVWIVLKVKILWSTLYKQINEVENKVSTFFTISLLWHLKQVQYLQVQIQRVLCKIN